MEGDGRSVRDLVCKTVLESCMPMFFRVLTAWIIVTYNALTWAFLTNGLYESETAIRWQRQGTLPSRLKVNSREQPRCFECSNHQSTSTKLHLFPWWKQADARKERDSTSKQRERIKQELIQLCRQPNPSRDDIEKSIGELTPLSPSPESARSPLLRKDWKLLWTSEKEINVFVDWGLATEVSQTIGSTSLNNVIRFKNGGSLLVSGGLSANDANPLRTDFQFGSATLDLGVRFIPTLNLPPVGKGWFDTVFLDEELRVDTNSRDDILICLAGEPTRE